MYLQIKDAWNYEAVHFLEVTNVRYIYNILPVLRQAKNPSEFTCRSPKQSLLIHCKSSAILVSTDRLTPIPLGNEPVLLKMADEL